VATGGVLWFGGFLPIGSTPTFEEVAKKVRDAQTLAYRMTMESPGQKDLASLQLFFKKPGVIRTEDANGRATILDLKTDRTLILDPKARTALLVEGKKPPDEQKPEEPGAFDVLQRLRHLVQKEGTPAGTKRIGDVDAPGFQVQVEGQETTVWADPKTRRPLRVEMPVRIGNQEGQVILSDFELDPNLDEALFLLEPPAGYTLTKRNVEEEKLEEEVARLLRAFAERSGGTFPKKLTDRAAYETQLQKNQSEGPDPEFVKLIPSLVWINLFQRRHKNGYTYKGDGVKLGDKGKILFWYKPEGAEKYRAVFGDLHAADVTADQLPEKPKQ
jgi:outer membrane lipoprotein-sorting protein